MPMVRGWMLLLAVTLLWVPVGGVSAVPPPADTAVSVQSPTPQDTCPAGPVESSTADKPQLVKLYPNTLTEGNAGEYFVLEFPDEHSVTNLTITDGHSTARIPAESQKPGERVTYSLEPENTAAVTSYPVAELDDHLRVAANGDDLKLRAEDAVIDTVSYERARAGEQWYRESEDEGVWWPAGSTCQEVTTGSPETATTFVLPDNPEKPQATLEAADDRIQLAGYTYTSEATTEALIEAADRGVTVEVLLEAGPVGGMPAETKAVGDELADAGVEVRLLGGENARYRFHHPKYAIVDEQLLVMTENWKPSGVGGTSSRGWGVIIAESTLRAELETVFEADFEGRDTVSWETYRTEATFVDDTANEREPFETQVDAETVAVEEAELVVAPDNAGDRFGELIADAEDSLHLKQVDIADDVGLLEETLEAARRGVSVRIALDSSWYVESDNRELAATLEQKVEDEELNLKVRLLEGGDAFEKIHAKGVIIDEETTVVGSVNWNENSIENNREVALVVHGEDVAAYYLAVFEADWEGEETTAWEPTLPVGLAVILAFTLLALGVASYRQLRFE